MPDILMARRWESMFDRTRRLSQSYKCESNFAGKWKKGDRFFRHYIKLFQRRENTHHSRRLSNQTFQTRSRYRSRLMHGSPESEFHNYVNVTNVVMNWYFSLKEEFLEKHSTAQCNIVVVMKLCFICRDLKTIYIAYIILCFIV